MKPSLSYVPVEYFTGARLTKRCWVVRFTLGDDVSYCCGSDHGHISKVNAAKCARKRWLRDFVDQDTTAPGVPPTGQTTAPDSTATTRSGVESGATNSQAGA